MNAKRHISLFLINHFLSGTRFFETKRKLLRFAGYRVGQGSRIVGPIFCTAALTIGENCWIGRNLTVHGNGAVHIGNHCDLGPDVTFFTGSHAIGGKARRAGTGESHTITVEDGCWIGGRATLLNAVTVGRGSVLAACGCVVRSVPPDTLAAGIPARAVRGLSDG